MTAESERLTRENIRLENVVVRRDAELRQAREDAERRDAEWRAEVQVWQERAGGIAAERDAAMAEVERLRGQLALHATLSSPATTIRQADQ